MTYTVTTALAVIPNADGTSGDGYFYEGATIPDGWNDERCKQLAEEGFLEKTKAAASGDGDGGSSGPAKVSDILAEVGDDVEKAKAALEAEQQERGEDARPSLVKKLEAVIANVSN